MQNPTFGEAEKGSKWKLVRSSSFGDFCDGTCTLLDLRNGSGKSTMLAAVAAREVPIPEHIEA